MSKMIEIMFHEWIFFIFFITVVCLGIALLSISCLLGGKTHGRYTHTPFESGIISVGSARLCFSVKFYLIAIFFVIFDVEALYLYTWSTSIRENGWMGFSEATAFILILLVGLFYLVRIGALDWSPISRKIDIKNDTILHNA
ncbi:NADH-quinone oxidoreductase subunit A [Candidatus Erwinia haradaeae]|nr:NADH-quinone oxidoreductase subunit A [Candidatus Erwinia haradaeae]